MLLHMAPRVSSIFQFASNLKSCKQFPPLRPRTGLLVLAGGSGSLKREATHHLYNWVSAEFDHVYTLLNPDEVYSARGVLPANVHPLNVGVHRLGGLLITGDRFQTECADVGVFHGYPRKQQVNYAHINVFQNGMDWTGKNGVLCLANDAKHELFDDARVYAHPWSGLERAGLVYMQ